MDRCRHTDTAFEHATYHALHIIERADIGNFDGIGYAAGFHQLDIDNIGGAHFNQLYHFARAKTALIGHNRGVHPLGNVF